MSQMKSEMEEGYGHLGSAEFICISLPNREMEELFNSSVRNVDVSRLGCCIPICPIGFSKADDYLPHDDLEYDSDEWSYDERYTPKLGPLHQADLARIGDKNEYDLAGAGEQVWDPSVHSQGLIAKYLAKTEAPPEMNVDEFTLDPEDEEKCRKQEMRGELENRIKLCTQEEALAILRQHGYNLMEALIHMKTRRLRWGTKKRNEPKWYKHDVDSFEKGMRNHLKEFNLIKKHEMAKSPKTLTDIIRYFYLWKKLPRYTQWANRKKQPNIYSTQSAPLKLDEPSRSTANPRLRNRPRVDYSQSSNGSHLWSNFTEGGAVDVVPFVPAPVVGSEEVVVFDEMEERKRKRPADDEFNVGGFEISVYAGIDYQKLREMRRRMNGESGEEIYDEEPFSLTSDSEALMDEEKESTRELSNSR
eukprot:TRINITY_DN3995_c0_g2_i2.p1 TRINITY_DN3995_c0_g2~~TRINITY_DN3995_c0_g2_i2.p1  ORF type:complete len:417 (+),score=93.38 TRINITY_DN3995_c0_g2_i2:18-1268(+)